MLLSGLLSAPCHLPLQVKAISFCKDLPPALAIEGLYVFFALTSAGVLGLWKLQIPSESGKKKKSKKSTAQVVLSTTPDCCVRVARDPSCDDEAADKQTIFAASFCSGGEIMVAYGNEVKPTLAQVDCSPTMQVDPSPDSPGQGRTTL